ncbi:MAG: DUF29 domain-containing protein [Hydrogenothermaceae bacterium]|nr:DUF29 domain-containing protein [Hydrogenothermaceae bacterium]
MDTKVISKEELKQLYDKDYPLWVEINLQLLKEKAYELVDWDNLLEEIEDMGRSDLKACISYLAVILEHLYKLDNFKLIAGGETAGSSWRKSIFNSRVELEAMFKNYPSLKVKLPYEIDKAWNIAVARLKIWLYDNGYNPDSFSIPEECPYSYQDALDKNINSL